MVLMFHQPHSGRTFQTDSVAAKTAGTPLAHSSARTSVRICRGAPVRIRGKSHCEKGTLPSTTQPSTWSHRWGFWVTHTQRWGSFVPRSTLSHSRVCVKVPSRTGERKEVRSRAENCSGPRGQATPPPCPKVARSARHWGELFSSVPPRCSGLSYRWRRHGALDATCGSPSEEAVAHRCGPVGLRGPSPAGHTHRFVGPV